MSELPDPFQSLRAFSSGSREGHIYSLPALEEAGLGAISRLPISIRIVLESALRNCVIVSLSFEQRAVGMRNTAPALARTTVSSSRALDRAEMSTAAAPAPAAERIIKPTFRAC